MNEPLDDDSKQRLVTSFPTMSAYSQSSKPKYTDDEYDEATASPVNNSSPSNISKLESKLFDRGLTGLSNLGNTVINFLEK